LKPVERGSQVELPKLALSVRQPWAWAIIHAGKDIENRDWHRDSKFRGRVAIHASSGMTRDEYEDAAETIENIVGKANLCPAAAVLARGAIIGSVEVIDCVRGPAFFGNKYGLWFFGPMGLVLRDPVPCKPIPCKGQLGFFEWQESGTLAPPAAWMLPKVEKQAKVAAVAAPVVAPLPLFDAEN
jgi:hypothetical protein